MKLTLTPTGDFAEINGAMTRRWEGHDEVGTPVHAYLAAVSPQTHDALAIAAFEEALQEMPKPERVEMLMFDFDDPWAAKA